MVTVSVDGVQVEAIPSRFGSWTSRSLGRFYLNFGPGAPRDVRDITTRALRTLTARRWQPPQDGGEEDHKAP